MKIFYDRRVQILLIITLVSLFIWFFYDGEEDAISFSQYREVQKEINASPKRSLDVQTSKHSPEEKAKIQTTKTVSNSQFDEAMILAKQANEHCQLAFRKLLPHKKWPEPFGPAYDHIQDLTALLNVGLTPSLAKEDHQVILALGAELGHEPSMPSERVQKFLLTFWELESCRGRDMATLLDAILELARKNKTMKKYRNGEVRDLVAQLWQNLVSAQQGYYTPTDLTFLLGFWQKAQAQGLIGEAHRGDLVGLVEKITNELHHEDVRLPRAGNPLTATKLLEFYREVQILGHELEEFGKEIVLDR